MIITNKDLVAELMGISAKAIEAANEWKQLGIDELNYKKTTKEWSILECVEHLNLYGDFYLPEIEKSILHASVTKTGSYKPGMIGNYFAGLMKPKAKMKKMQSPPDKNPSGNALNETTIERFLKQTERIRTLLVKSERVDLGRAKTAISISKLVKLRLGDTLRFYVYHIGRHVSQALKIAPASSKD